MTITEFENSFSGYTAKTETEDAQYEFDSTTNTPHNSKSTIDKIRVQKSEYEILDGKLRELLGVKLTEKTSEVKDGEGEPTSESSSETYYELSSDSLDAIDAEIKKLQKSTVEVQTAINDTQTKVSNLENNTAVVNGAYVYRGSLKSYEMLSTLTAYLKDNSADFAAGKGATFEIADDGTSLTVYSKKTTEAEGVSTVSYVGTVVEYDSATGEVTSTPFDDVTEAEYEARVVAELASGAVFNVETTSEDSTSYTGMNYAYNDATFEFDALGGVFSSATAATYNAATETTAASYTGGNDGLMSAKDKTVVDNLAENTIVTGSVSSGVLSFSTINAATGESVEI